MTDNIDTTIQEIETIEGEIFKLKSSITSKINSFVEEKTKLTDLLNEKLLSMTDNERKSKDYGCGTFNIDSGLYKSKIVISKKVKWDEKRLDYIKDQIEQAGRDVSEFMKVKLSVSEKTYKDLSPEMKQVFKQARTVEPSVPKITFERKV